MRIVRVERGAIGAICGAAIILVMAGCVVQRPAQRYTRAETTQEQFMQDRYECLQEAQRGPTASCNLISACMGARGYILNPAGDLAPPPGMAVACQYY